MTDDNLIVQVAAHALVVNDKGEVLVLREAPTYKDGTNVGKYHFPGGRLNHGERYLDALHREVMEEVGLTVEAGKPISISEWRSVIHGREHHIIAITTLCKAKTTDIRLSEEHDEFKWIHPDKRAEHDLLPSEAAALEAYLKDVATNQ